LVVGFLDMLVVAEAIGYKALKALRGSGGTARVYSAFDHALYIRPRRGSLISVIRDRDYIGPASILLRESSYMDFKSMGINEGTRIEVRNDRLVFQGSVLTIEMGSPSIWFPPPIPRRSELVGLGSMSLNLRVLRDMIYTAPSREGLVPLLENVELYGPLQIFLKPQKPTLSERTRPYIETLMWGLFWGDIDAIISNALQILGLGPGLTPSCDDFLTGLILGLVIGGKVLLRERRKELVFYRRVSSEICRAAKGKTTIYSEILLNQARRGEGPHALIGLIHALLTGGPDRVASLSKTVIAMGETSGADISIGVYYGIRFLVSRLERMEDLLSLMDSPDGIA
jgi:hypothetical protein